MRNVDGPPGLGNRGIRRLSGPMRPSGGKKSILVGFLLLLSQVSLLSLGIPSRNLPVTVKALSAIKQESDDPRIPCEARLLLRELKSELRFALEEALAEQRGLPVDLDSLTKKAEAHLAELAPNPSELPQDPPGATIVHPFGGYDFAFATMPNLPNALALTTTMSLGCGIDTSLYIYLLRDSHWVRVYTLEAGDYEDTSGAHSHLYFKAIPCGYSDRFAVAFAYFPDWCQSAWRELHYGVDWAEPMSRTVRPVKRGTSDVWIGGDERIVDINLSQDEVTFAYLGWNDGDPAESPAKPKQATISIQCGHS